MKKFLTMLMVASIFSLVACGPTEEEKVADEAKAAEKVEEMMVGLEEVAEEVVAEDVVAEDVAVEGEEATEEEAHVHAEGEEHSH
tara:strand:- start:249 stop:503 length:255 start_codon:yes stop_codon:yes gene_type:complete